MGAFVICSLESIIARQLNLVHSKLQASIEQADFSKMWSEILKKRDAAHIEPTHYPNLTVTISCYMYIVVNILPVTDSQPL